MIDNEERVEAAAKALRVRYSQLIGAGTEGYLPESPGTLGANWLDYARTALAAADAVTAETHWLAPNQIETLWPALREAYLAESESSRG